MKLAWLSVKKGTRLDPSRRANIKSRAEKWMTDSHFLVEPAVQACRFAGLHKHVQEVK